MFCHSPGCLCSRCICRRSWSLRSHVHNSWKLHYNPGLLCTKYTCRNCWYSRNRTNMTVKSHHNPDYQLRSDICSDNPTTIWSSRMGVKRQFGYGSCRCRLPDTLNRNPHNTAGTHKGRSPLYDFGSCQYSNFDTLTNSR